MDDLVHLDLLNELENVEEVAEGGELFAGANRNALEELDAEMFRKMFRLTRGAFDHLLQQIRPLMGEPTKASDLRVEEKLLIALRFFATGSYQLDIGLNSFLNVSQPSVSRSIKEVITILNNPQVFNHWVKFPRNFEELNATGLRFYQEYNFPGIIGCIDCTHVAIFPPKNEDEEHPEHLYVNRKGYHSINVQLICDVTLRITNVCARYPGSTNDAFIWQNSAVHTLMENLHEAGHKDYFLLGDSGYPLRSYLITPIEQEQQPGTPEYAFNVAHRHTRSLIERCNGVLKTRFRCCLKHRVLHYSPEQACKIINACVVLHNICIHFNIENEADEAEDDVDYGILNAANNENVQDNIGQVNPQLLEGRRARARIINNVFN